MEQSLRNQRKIGVLFLLEINCKDTTFFDSTNYFQKSLPENIFFEKKSIRFIGVILFVRSLFNRKKKKSTLQKAQLTKSAKAGFTYYPLIKGFIIVIDLLFPLL